MSIVMRPHIRQAHCYCKQEVFDHFRPAFYALQFDQRSAQKVTRQYVYEIHDDCGERKYESVSIEQGLDDTEYGLVEDQKTDKQDEPRQDQVCTAELTEFVRVCLELLPFYIELC
eukprot:TRINITY_DN4674_c1_g1_i1.p7 TRINITY_DN4674_c1_g1~~TRINITY_DN4674_c1_g1_i1.p7  ORF type:complete len:115 (+),score=5.71 TRINITY_DN4674_c1_g1_i1:1750-2094(+)